MRGFSLVELSIVLVILGLLTGGILAGQNLIRAAEIRSVTSEYQRYQTAANTFRDKYFATPGDMRNATDFWGSANTAGTNGECANSPVNAGTGTQTCDGDGDGTINGAGTNTASGERFRFWQHLANAGLIEGSYTGIQGSAGINHHEVGVNVPRSRISNAGFSVLSYSNANCGSITGSTFLFPGPYCNVFVFGLEINGFESVGEALAPEEAWNIDTKVDDGRPAFGRVTTRAAGTGAGAFPNCTTGDPTQGATAEYQLTFSGLACGLHFSALR